MNARVPIEASEENRMQVAWGAYIGWPAQDVLN